MRLRLSRLKPASPETLAWAGLWAGLLDLAAAGSLLLIAVDAWAPPQDLPWKPFRLDRPPGLATQAQFRRAAASPARCRQALAEGGVSFTEEADRRAGGCATRNTVRVHDGTAAPLAPAGPVVTCPLALGYAAWSRQVVQPAARELLGQPVARIEHYGSFACRNIYGEAAGRRSEHAFANALDVAAFRTASGQRVSVAADYRRGDRRGDFLRRVRAGACPWFRAVLGPDYNAAHRDHFHLDAGPYRVCR